MRAQPNISTSAKFPCILPVYVGMEMILTQSYLPPRLVRGTPVLAVDIELHPREQPLHNRPSVASHGCVLLEDMPLAMYVHVKDCGTVFLKPGADAPQLGALDMKGILAVQPVCRSWKFQPTSKGPPVLGFSNAGSSLTPKSSAHCTEFRAILRALTSLLIGLSRRTFSKESIWLAYYVSLSRPRSWPCLLCRTMPDRDIIEGGPPESIAKAFGKLFTTKIQTTNVACARARRGMGWPPHL